MSQSTPTPDTTARTETAETVTVPRGLLSDAEAEAANLGRFGHHPDAAIDFCVEVETLTGRLHSAKYGISKPGTEPETIMAVADDIMRAMTFKVGGDEGAVYAKHCLRKLEDEAVVALASPQHPVGVREALASREELDRYINKCRELSSDENGRTYTWWSRLADILATLSHPPAQDAPGAVAMREALEKIAGSHYERVGHCVTDMDEVPDCSAQEAMELARAALDPSPPLPEADGEVVAWLCGDPATGQWIEVDGTKLEYSRGLGRPAHTLASAFKAQRDRADAAEHALSAERAAREKAEQVAAGLREVVKRGYQGWSNVVELRLLPPQHVRSAEELRDLFWDALRASTEEGKTATPSVTDEEAQS